MSRLKRRHVIASTLALGVATPNIAFAQAYPNRPITLTTSFPAGGPQDLLLRAMTTIVGAELKQPVVLDNKPGASGGLSLAHTATQKPDGYALNAPPSAGLVNLPLMQKLSFDPAKDFDEVVPENRTGS